VTELGQRCIST